MEIISQINLLTFRPKYLDTVLQNAEIAFYLCLLLQRQSGGQERAEEL